mmetsp:Transcript_8655/g.15278  ORF Transcript_8655/g.15278 Transcript_8655/m.15278 type:complete len:169 (+) Transcript_8655:118-624(+)|eukprot:CAMPEP_0184697746 /NCGR_PEP_ID=MMETSP0313-20130426/4607_1 /TAXON_ID=2792 /ORGANISM="Porphyridium aerugineum, Strain SAG 1380-2" /LENGTH=168 /DNA_ID=CAMNT_0027156581 /DNA_START=84 /DNA_END=590 /DNA_ORIENTATION=+
MSEAQLRAWFNYVDKDGSGTVTCQELQTALVQANIRVSLESCAMLIRMYDSKRSATVNYDEFRNLHNFILSVQQSFYGYDVDRNGKLDSREIWLALQKNGFNLDMPAFDAAFKAFDPTNSGFLELDDFICLAAYLSSAKSMFTAFDPQNSGSITMNFSQFIYASSHLR